MHTEPERKNAELVVVTKAKDFCSYVMEVTQKSPKQYRFTYVSRMQNLALSIIENILRANDLLVGGKHGVGNFQRRHDYQMEAITGDHRYQADTFAPKS